MSPLEAKTKLLEWVKTGTIVYTYPTHKTGKFSSVKPFIIHDNKPIDITFHIGRLLAQRIDDIYGGIRVKASPATGGGEIVRQLGEALGLQLVHCEF